MSANVEQLQQQLRQLTTAMAHMTTAMAHMAACLGTRLTRDQLCDRLGVHRNTLTRRLEQDRSFPRPGKDGRWLLSEVIEWEQAQARH